MKRRTLLATAAMAVACIITRMTLPAGHSLAERAMNVVAPIATAFVTYLAVSRLIGFKEPWQLLRRDAHHGKASDD